MRKIIYLVALFLCVGLAAYSVIGTRPTPTSPKSEKREVREQRRAARQAEYERLTDSIVLAHAFQFIPQTMQQEIAGPMRMLSNPNFEVGIYDDAADIFLPYIKGMAPPYHYTILNYTIPGMSDFVTEQTASGWRVSFTTSLYSASTYTFVFEINSKYGGATLNVKNTWNNTVQYTGSISRYY